MATVQEQILMSFFGKLADTDELDEETITALRSLLQSDKKVKAEEVVALLKENTEGAE